MGIQRGNYELTTNNVTWYTLHQLAHREIIARVVGGVVLMDSSDVTNLLRGFRREVTLFLGE